jgi:lipoprotein-releasing system permease protein
MNSFILFYVQKSLFNKDKKFKLQSLISFLGIIFSVIILTLTFSLFTGYETTLKNVILGANSHIYFFRAGSGDLTKSDVNEISKFLEVQPEVTAFSPVVMGTGIIAKDKRLKNVAIKGLDWRKEKLPVRYKEYVKDGTWRLENKNDAVIGDKLAENLNLKIGDIFTVISPAKSKFTLTGLKQEKLKLKIVGLYNSGMEEYDASYVVINPETAFKFNGNDEYTILEVRLKDELIDDANEVALNWEYELSRDYQINTWIYFNGNLFSILTLQKWILMGILSLLLIIASFNLVSSTTTDILEHQRDIGILKAFGLNDKALKLVFLLRLVFGSILATLIGQFTGVVLGIFIANQNFFTLKGDVYFIEKLTFEYGFIPWLLVFSLSVLIVTISALIPLKRINRLDISEIIRN